MSGFIPDGARPRRAESLTSFLQEKYHKAHHRRRSKVGNPSDPVSPVLSGRDQVSPTPTKANRPPDRGRRYARKYHAIMATAWSISAQPEPIGASLNPGDPACRAG